VKLRKEKKEDKRERPFLNYLLIMIRGLKFLYKKKKMGLIKKMGLKLKKLKNQKIWAKLLLFFYCHINPRALGEHLTRQVV
jgi:hypothetical protein